MTHHRMHTIKVDDGSLGCGIQYNLLGGYQRFGEICCFHLQGQIDFDFVTEDAGSSFPQSICVHVQDHMVAQHTIMQSEFLRISLLPVTHKFDPVLLCSYRILSYVTSFV
jgi:hypothetical protein